MKEITKAPVRVTVDTNIFISALLGSKNCRKIYELFVHSKIDLILSPQLFAELNETLTQSKLRQYFKKEDIEKLNKLLETDAEWVFPKEKISICRDSKDNIILECACAGKVDFIVTGDKDLLSLKKFRKTLIISPRQFLKLF